MWMPSSRPGCRKSGVCHGGGRRIFLLCSSVNIFLFRPLSCSPSSLPPFPVLRFALLPLPLNNGAFRLFSQRFPPLRSCSVRSACPLCSLFRLLSLCPWWAYGLPRGGFVIVCGSNLPGLFGRIIRTARSDRVDWVQVFLVIRVLIVCVYVHTLLYMHCYIRIIKHGFRWFFRKNYAIFASEWRTCMPCPIKSHGLHTERRTGVGIPFRAVGEPHAKPLKPT